MLAKSRYCIVLVGIVFSAYSLHGAQARDSFRLRTRGDRMSYFCHTHARVETSATKVSSVDQSCMQTTFGNLISECNSLKRKLDEKVRIESQ